MRRCLQFTPHEVIIDKTEERAAHGKAYAALMRNLRECSLVQRIEKDEMLRTVRRNADVPEDFYKKAMSPIFLKRCVS